MSLTALGYPAVLERLRALRDDVVPVIGAGLASSCGATSSDELAAALAEAGGIAISETLHLFEVANNLEDEHGTEWVQHVVANAVTARSPTPSLAMQAITLIPGRVVLTTNYCNAIELAGAAHGLEPVSLVPAQLPKILRGPSPGELFVVHVHGAATDPSSIVLTRRTYAAAAGDEALQLAVRALATGRSLVFLGHSLAVEERHLRRDISGVVDLFGPAAHLMLHAKGDASVGDAAEFFDATGVEPVACPNDDGLWGFVTTAAQALGAPPVVRSRTVLPGCSAPLDAAYHPMLAAPAHEVETEAQRQVWIYSKFFDRQLTVTSDLAEGRLLLVGKPGNGKTQALLHLARDSPDPAVYLRLGGVAAPRDGEARDAVFVDWMQAAACALKPDVPQVTGPALAEGVFGFFLDGLDEVQPDKRSAVLSLIADVSQRYPQHRWVIASRRVPHLVGALSGFADYELVESRDWLLAYGGQRGIAPDQIDALVGGAPGLTELIQMPIFAAAAVEAILDGDDLPTTPLGLLLDFASRGMKEEEARLRSDRVEIDQWLDRLSLAMLAAGVDTAAPTDAADAILRGKIDDEVTLEWLISRVLLQDAGGAVRPLSRPLRDARAARALQDHPKGVDVIRRYGIFKVAGEEHLRPEWQYVVDLLLSDDLERWNDAVEHADVLSVARAIAREEPITRRAAAVATIWSWYRDHRLHIPRTREGQLLDDLEALVGLAHDGLAPTVRSEVTSALDSPDEATRGNAIAILSRTEPSFVASRLPALLDDSNAVVRRRAAEAIAHLNLKGLVERLFAKGLADSDDLARRTLVGVAVEIADDAEVANLMDRLPAALRQDVQLGIDRRWPRRRQLDYLLGKAGPEVDWLEHLAQFDRADWAAADVARLATLWRRYDFHGRDREVRRVLAAHPHDALRACFAEAVDSRALFDLMFLLDAVDLVDLEAFADAAGSQAAELVAEYVSWRRAPAGTEPTAAVPPPQPQPSSLAETIGGGDVDAVLSHDARSAVEELDDTGRAALVELIAQAWVEPTDVGPTPTARVTRDSPTEWHAARRDWQLIAFASALHLRLPDDEWFMMASLGLAGHDDWLAATFDEAWTASVASRLASINVDGLIATLECALGSMSSDAADVIAHRVMDTDDPQFRKVAARRLAADGHVELLRALAIQRPSEAFDAALIVVGDADAEARALDRFAADGCPASWRWGGEHSWVEGVRDVNNAPAVFAALRTMLRRGDEPHELGPLFRALDRCLGAGVLARYDELIGDAHIPGAAFLWYQREEAVARLAGVQVGDLGTIAHQLYAPTT